MDNTDNLLHNQLDFHSYLPPYRSLLSPHARYDYQTHSLIPISQNDLALPALNSPTKTKSKIKMKYKSLLGDVSRRTSILSMRINISNQNPNLNPNLLDSNANANANTSSSPTTTNNVNSFTSQAQLPPVPPLQFKNLPMEILQYILELVDDFDDYKCCMLINKQFYQLTKPFLYESLSFTSTFKFAQFVTYLRLNSEVGLYVREIDLSGIKPSNFGIEEEDEDNEQTEVEQNQRLIRSRNSLDMHNRSTDDVHFDDPPPFILAGWRDWKFKSNPLYSIQPASSFNLTKIRSNSQVLARSLRSANYSMRSKSSSRSTSSASKMQRLSKYFKNRKRQRIEVENSRARSNDNVDLPPEPTSIPCSSSSRRLYQYPHPSMNKLLYNYSSSKDIPIGYIIHTLNLCPNLVSINLANLSLSVDYEINPKMAYKYQTYDLMNNYSKELLLTINKIMSAPTLSDESSFCGSNLIRALSDKDSLRSFPFSSASIRSTLHHAVTGGNIFPGSFKGNNTFNINNNNNNNNFAASSASSVYSFHPPTRPRYNSLLPPLPQTVADMAYINKGDGKVFLSDLNLKSINTSYLTRLPEMELLKTIAKIHSNRFGKFNTLRYLNLSSMIWLTKMSVQEFLSEFLSDSPCLMSDDESQEDDASLDTSSVLSRIGCEHCTQDLVIDLTDSGMYKNLLWAKRIDLKSAQGNRLATRIIRDEILDAFEYNTRREQTRRGRMGENYFS